MLILPLALYLLQNALTTGLIMYRIWSQLCQAHTITRKRPLSLHTPSIVSTIIIIVESAMIYTAGMMRMAIVICIRHPIQYLFYCCQVPIAGADHYFMRFLLLILQCLQELPLF